MAAAQAPTDADVVEAIALGKKGIVPTFHVGAFLGDFDIYIEGPITRIAAAADAATRDFRPFELSHVTAEMRTPGYAVYARPKEFGPRVSARRIVLQPRGAQGMDGVIQPVREGRTLTASAIFDRLPEGDFDVVVVTAERPQRYWVRAEDRPRIR